jgi:prefoldin alpha subunit
MALTGRNPHHDVFMIPEDIHIRSQTCKNNINAGWWILTTTTQPMDQRELMTLQHYMKEYGQQAEIFVSQLDMLENGRMEALAAIDALQGMVASDDGTVLLQIGGGASVRAKVLEPEKILIAIGAEVIVERSNKEAVDFLKERIMEMEASQKKVAETLERLRAQMNEINKRLESGYQQSMAEQDQD